MFQMQYAYPDGGLSDTEVIVDLYYAQNKSQIVRKKIIKAELASVIKYLPNSYNINVIVNLIFRWNHFFTFLLDYGTQLACSREASQFRLHVHWGTL